MENWIGECDILVKIHFIEFVVLYKGNFNRSENRVFAEFDI
jgi:hypothetical protein